MEVEEDREALSGGEREAAHVVAVFPQVLSRRGVGEIDDCEAEGDNDRRCGCDVFRAGTRRIGYDGGGATGRRKRG